MDLRHLRNFVAIVDSGSLSKAAEQVHVAQPALSQQMAGLEHDFKAKLLVRSPQGVVPTDAGKVLYRHARTVLRQIEQVRQEVAHPISGESAPVAVGLPSTMVAALALPLFKRVRAHYPGIRLHLFEGMSAYLAELVAHGRLDMAIQFRDAETRGVAIQPLLTEDLYVIGNPPGYTADDAMCPLRALNGVPMVLPMSAQALRVLVERSFAQANLELNVIAEIDSFRTGLAIAGEGLACTILPLSALMPRENTARHSARLLIEPGIRRPVSLAWSTSLPRTDAALAVQRTIVSLVEELVSNEQWAGARLPAQV